MGDEASQKFGGNWHREGILSRSKTKRYFLFVIQKFSLVRDRLCTPYLDCVVLSVLHFNARILPDITIVVSYYIFNIQQHQWP